MSVLKYQETMSSEDVQIWDNAAFYNGESEGSEAIKFSWSTMKPTSTSLSQSLESDSTKENQTPSMANSPVSIRSLASINPLQTNTALTNTQQSIPISEVSLSRRKENLSDERNLDLEIEEIEKQICRLSSRLETLRIEKAKRNAKAMEKRGRIVAAKFMNPPKQSSKNFEEQSKMEELMSLNAKSKTPRRGLSLGPAEITRGTRKGISLGPAEIYSATKTPVQPSSNRRKSCYWKLQDIDELRVTKERGKSWSLSPKSRSKTVLKSQAPKEAATTIGSKKTVKKEDGLISSIQPKKLFAKDGEKSVSAKKPMKCGRVVASRYSQISNGGNSAMKELRKRSLPESEEDAKKSERKRVSLTGKSQDGALQATARENRVKKRWEISSEVAIQNGIDHETPLSVSKMLDVVPKIKTSRVANKSPRDSGPAKRVSELIGRKSYFCMDDNENGNCEEKDESVCQALDFAEAEGPKECLNIKVLCCVDDSPRDSGAAKRVAELVGKKSFFDDDDDNEMPVFSFEEEDDEES